MTTKRWMKVHVALESCSTCFNQRFSIGPKQLPAGTIWPRRALHQLPDCPILQSPASRPSAPPLAHTEIVLKTCSLFNWAIQWAAWGGWSLNLSGQLGEFSSDSWFYCLPVGSGGDAQWVKCTSWLIDWVSTQRADRYWDRSNAVLVKKLQLIIFIWWPYLLLTCVMYRIWGELRSWSFDDWWCRFRDVCFAPKKKSWTEFELLSISWQLHRLFMMISLRMVVCLVTKRTKICSPIKKENMLHSSPSIYYPLLS